MLYCSNCLSVCTSIRQSAFRFRTTLVFFDHFSSNFAWALILGMSVFGLQLGYFFINNRVMTLD